SAIHEQDITFSERSTIGCWLSANGGGDLKIASSPSYSSPALGQGKWGKELRDSYAPEVERGSRGSEWASDYKLHFGIL
ncbi:MAG: hypothetical protein JXA46_17290, partial [Dehalococcoidales bacterium]|nr:hypothetical protein [Dehalococcoidales bacterium]